MADKTVSLKVSGVAELNRALKQAEKQTEAGLRTAFLGIAQRVVGVTQQRMPHRSGSAQRSVKARASKRGASIAAGGTAAPFYQWLDFGGSVGRGHKVGVPWSGSVKREWRGVPSGSGRYLYPAISQERAHTEAVVLDLIEASAKRAGLTVKGG